MFKLFKNLSDSIDQKISNLFQSIEINFNLYNANKIKKNILGVKVLTYYYLKHLTT